MYRQLLQIQDEKFSADELELKACQLGLIFYTKMDINNKQYLNNIYKQEEIYRLGGRILLTSLELTNDQSVIKDISSDSKTYHSISINISRCL